MHLDDSEDGAMALSQLQQSGGSVILTIPQDMVSRLGVEIGQKIHLKVKDGVLTIERHPLSSASSEQSMGTKTAPVAYAPVAYAEEWGRLRAKFESRREIGGQKSK